MAAEPEHVGECPDNLESALETADDVTRRILVLAALQSQRNAEMLANLPPSVKRRVKALEKIRLEATHEAISSLEEFHAIKCKYHKLLSAVYEKHGIIIGGEYKTYDEEFQWAFDEEDEFLKHLKDIEEPISQTKAAMKRRHALPAIADGPASKRSSYETAAESSDVKPTTAESKTLRKCPICLEPLDKQEISATVCGHIFCTTCIKQTIKSTKTCPICRSSLNFNKIHPIFF